MLLLDSVTLPNIEIGLFVVKDMEKKKKKGYVFQCALLLFIVP